MSPRLLACLLALFISGTACVPPEPDDDVMRTFDAETTVMGRVQEAGILRVGVPNDRPALADPDTGEGFLASLAEEVAESLGTDIEIVPAANDELIPAIDAGEIDLAFPAVAITEERVRQDNDKHLFLDPYLVSHQRLLVQGTAVASDLRAESLAGKPVCAASDPETEIDLTVIEPTIDLQGVAVPEECASLFERGETFAATGSDVVLLGIAQTLCPEACPEGETTALVGDQLSTFGYGPVIEGGATSWKDYVVNVLEEAQQEGRWEEYYEEHLTELSEGEVLEPPGMTVEEAAALFPKEL